MRGRIQSPDMGEERLFTLAEVAEDTGYTQRQLRRLAAKGVLPADKYGKTYLVKQSALDRFTREYQPSTGRPRGSKTRRRQSGLLRCAETPAAYDPTPPPPGQA